MTEDNETSLEAQAEILRAQAADADMQGVSIDELSDPIGENTGAGADPEKENGADDSTETKTPEDGGESGAGDGSEETGSEGGAQGAESSNADNRDGPSENGKPEKAKKEAERRDRSWKKLEEEKAKFLREKAEFEAAKLAAAPAAPQHEQNPATNPNVLADQFENLARNFEAAGDFDKADEAREKAKALRQIQTQAPANAGGAMPQRNVADNPQFKVAWQANLERALNDYPEMKDVNSEFGKTVQALLRAPDSASYFSGRPDGVYVAAQLANMKMTALRVPALEKEISALKEENKKLRQGMSIPESGATDRSGETRSFGSMSLEEQKNYLRRQAEMEDASTRPVLM